MTRYLSEEEPTGKPTITPEEALRNPRNHGKDQFYEILANMVYCRICGTVYYGRTAGICNACNNELEPFVNIISPQPERRRTQRAGDVLRCGHSEGIEFGESSWVCVVCGQPARP